VPLWARLPLLLLLACSAPSAQQPKSCLVIILDDVGAGDVTPTTTPKLCAIADGGMRFTRAYSWPVCCPSRYAALFGRYPRRNGVGDLDFNAFQASHRRLPNDLLSLAELVKPTHATAIIGKWHLGRADLTGGMNQVASGPFAQGFDIWHAGNPTVIDTGPGASGYYSWNRVTQGTVSLSINYATDVQVDDFTDWWTATAGPKFCWLSFAAAHAPFDVPPGHGQKTLVRDQYLGVLDYLDGAIDQALASVDMDETYVFIFGDNGTPEEAKQAGGPTGHWKGTTFEGGVRVPLIVLGPGVGVGESARLVSLMDVPATACEILGTTIHGMDDSQSFADDLGSWAGSEARTWVFAERYLSGHDEMAAIEASWKLIIENGVESIYYLPNDPLEMNPLDPAIPALATISARLHAEIQSLPARQ